VELNASARARVLLAETGIISGPDEQRGVQYRPQRAALTYVAALVTAMLAITPIMSCWLAAWDERRR